MFLLRKSALIVGVAGTVGGLLIIFGLAAAVRLAKVYAGWMGFALLLSKVTTPIFMGAVYFLVISPIGALMRALGRNPLKTAAPETAWFTRPLGARRGALERQF